MIIKFLSRYASVIFPRLGQISVQPVERSYFSGVAQPGTLSPDVSCAYLDGKHLVVPLSF